MVNRVSCDELLFAARLVWVDKGISRQIAFDSYTIFEIVEERKINFCSGRKFRALAGGLFYLLSFRYGNPVKQSEIAKRLGASEVTIRESYRKWLIAFPDLFRDIIEKLSHEDSLKYFVLIDLKQEIKG